MSILDFAIQSQQVTDLQALAAIRDSKSDDTIHSSSMCKRNDAGTNRSSSIFLDFSRARRNVGK